jgi:DNA-binding NarL/FixJ family response regulator
MAADEGGAVEPMRVLIADDHPVYRDGLRLLLADEADIEVVATAAGGMEAVDSARDRQPDVIVMDLQMDDLNGIEATRRIVHDSPHINVLVLTMFDDDESVFAAMRAGARGYVLKGAGPDEIIRAIRTVGHGSAVFGVGIAQRVIDYFAAHQAASTAAVFPELTEREREVLALIADGASNPTIAKLLFLSPKTVRNHVSNIFSKLQVADRAEAILRARRGGLGGV